VILPPGLNVFRACAKLMTCCQLIDRWFVYKAKEGCHVRINKNHCECRVHGEGSQGLNPEIPGCSINTTDFPVIKVYVTDFPVVNVHVDELSSARNWQHKLCATFFESVNINYHLQRAELDLYRVIPH
jgi:hypothetical protein